ncbi:hypothetical protein N7493_000860 [Penicillium malachiteum]|uniref:Uncharacterized protein n=1 Tax=Penicillium malachiteum TaxID=1324776 RepID=A0AAD6HXU0_9EURO|nr:hypothetical protein N7493_000860 [Penicillium malachiteum]
MAVYLSLLGRPAPRPSFHSNGSGHSFEYCHTQQKPVETKNGVKQNKKKSKKTEKKKADLFSEDESQIDLGGSPWDPTERKHLKVEDLDLHKSYVDDYKEASRISQEQEEKTERPSRGPKWNYKGNEPLTDISKLIEMGWDTREPDLDLTQANISTKNIQRSESQDLSESAIKRIASLRETELALEKKGITSQLVNVQAILAAYRSKALDWTDGLVTYWSGGQQLCQPRPFSWDEFEAINDACNRPESFWVEGYNIALRLPGRNWWTELEFQFDTGCSDMLLYEADLNLIAGPERDPALTGTGGTILTPIIKLEGTILDARGCRMGLWISFCCQVDDYDYQANPPFSGVPGSRKFSRLDGGLFRKYYYYMLSPDQDYTLKIADSRHALLPLIRGLMKEERVHLIHRRIQYWPDQNVPNRNFTLAALGNNERALLEGRRPESPPAEPRFFKRGG